MDVPEETCATVADQNLSFVQIALNTCDPAGTLRLYSEAFGAVSGGGNAFWGGATKSQGLDDQARGVIFWLLGQQPFTQFEIFQHTYPEQRPISADHRPCDIGWVRFGIAVVDFDRTLTALDRAGVSTLTEPVKVDGLRRVAFRDPFIGVVVEIFEDGARRVGRKGSYEADPRPAIVYAACSVSDLEGARDFYGRMLGMNLLSREVLHSAEHEALWGLDGAQASGFLALVGDKFIEVMHYHDPKGRKPPADRRIVDQGIMNIGLGSRSVPLIKDLHGQLRQEGLTMTPAFDDGRAMATYIVDPEREVELIGLEQVYDETFGFAPGTPFFR